MRQLGFVLTGMALAVFSVGLWGCASSSAPDQGAPAQPAAATGSEQAPEAGHEEHAEHEHGEHAESAAEEHGEHAEAGHEEHAEHEHGEHAEAGHEGSAMEKMKEGLAKLSEEDRASAEQQHVCPVSGKMLGTMGAPIKVDVNGQQVWICCPGCKSKLLAEPDKYLAKLNR